MLVHSKGNFVCRSFQTSNCSHSKYSWKWETKWTLHASIVSPSEEEPLKTERARGMYLWQNSIGPKRNVSQTWVTDHYKWGFNDDTVFSGWFWSGEQLCGLIVQEPDSHKSGFTATPKALRSMVAECVIFLTTLHYTIYGWWSYTHNSDQNVTLEHNRVLNGWICHPIP